MAKEFSGDNEYQSFINSYGWHLIPDHIFIKIFKYLSISDLTNAGICCHRWNLLSKDDFLWKKIFQRDFKIDNNIGLKPGAESWYAEYKRLHHHIPMILTEELPAHAHQVLHVSFSHNGKLFATCSKDGFVIIWNATYPATLKYSHDMKKFQWKYTQYSEFNETDTLLLVSGVHFGSPHSTSGEIAVFSVTGVSHLRCRASNKPYDIFGTWFSDQHFISGDLHWLAHLVSTSILWLNKANQEIDSEHVPIMNQLYKFYNKNISSVRSIMIANCPWLDDKTTAADNNNEMGASETEQFSEHLENDIKYGGNPVSQRKSSSLESDGASSSSSILDYSSTTNKHNSIRSIHYSDDYRREYEDNFYESDDMQVTDEDDTTDNTDDGNIEDETLDDDLDNLHSKYLIFSTGSKTYTPHQIGFKRISNLNFPKKLDPGPSLHERILAARERERELQNNPLRTEPDWLNFESVANRFDKVDKLIDLHGHIIGMALSPDHRYLYVNCRPWPQNYIISNALEPPPIAQQIDIHVIDLVTFKRVGKMLRAHKAYTPNTECFFIFLNVCDNYVVSGAEDMHAYIWDRYYGICLAKYQHADVVNSVAFNSKDSEMLVTTSDDYTIRIWRSISKAKYYQTEGLKQAIEFRRKI